MVADLRNDPARQVNAYMNIGSGFGAAFGGMAGDKIRQKKEYEKLYLEAANERLISTLSLASAEGWDKPTTHAAVSSIDQWAKTKAGERYTFNLQRDSMKKNEGDVFATIQKLQSIYDKAFEAGDTEMADLAQ